MTQCEKIYDYLKSHGSITGMECINLGVMNYKGRLFDLRKLGVAIETKMESRVNAKGEKKTYARYYLA